MYPILIKLGPFTLHAYGLMAALGLLAAWLVVQSLAKRQGMDPEKVSNLTLWVALGGLAGARLGQVALNPAPYLARPLSILAIWQGGLAFYGGLLVALPLGLWLIRRWRLGLLPTMDLFAPALALGQALGRIGCFFSGDSFGKPFDGPWAVVFRDPHSLAPKGIPLHPTQLYTAGALLIITAVLLVVRPRKDFNGQIFLLYGLMHGIARLIIEQFRADWRGTPLFGGVTPTMAVAAVLAATCLAGLIIGKIHKGMTRPQIQERG